MKIKCKICGNEYISLGFHLKTKHNITIDQYKEMYPGSPVNKKELNNYIDKIIWYDNHNKMTNEIVQWGGDTFTDDIHNVYEGEYMSGKVMEVLPGYTTTQLWGSENTLTKLNCAKGFKSGADFVDTSGHGSPVSWATHAPEDENVWIPAKFLFSVYTGW